MAKKLSTVAKRSRDVQATIALVVIIIIVSIGYKLLNSSHAATPYASGYAVSGTAAGTTATVSGGSSPSSTALQLGTAATTGTGGSTLGCSSGGVVAPCVGSATTAGTGWGTPTYDDEFTKDTSLNTSTWTPYWFSNGTAQNATYMYSSNVTIANGYLNLEASGSEGASGGLISSDPSDNVSGHTGYQYTYGFYEVRANIPASGSEIANWPAIWAVGQDWPEDGELDVMEGLSGQAGWHFHYGSGSGSQVGGFATGSFTGWHTFAANWQPGSITWYYDGVQVGQETGSIVTTEPMFLILENSTGSYGLLPVTTPSDMQVAYVRVWQ